MFTLKVHLRPRFFIFWYLAEVLSLLSVITATYWVYLQLINISCRGRPDYGLQRVKRRKYRKTEYAGVKFKIFTFYFYDSGLLACPDRLVLSTIFVKSNPSELHVNRSTPFVPVELHVG